MKTAIYPDSYDEKWVTVQSRLEDGQLVCQGIDEFGQNLAVIANRDGLVTRLNDSTTAGEYTYMVASHDFMHVATYRTHISGEQNYRQRQGEYLVNRYGIETARLPLWENLFMRHETCRAAQFFASQAITRHADLGLSARGGSNLYEQSLLIPGYAPLTLLEKTDDADRKEFTVIRSPYGEGIQAVKVAFAPVDHRLMQWDMEDVIIRQQKRSDGTIFSNTVEYKEDGIRTGFTAQQDEDNPQAVNTMLMMSIPGLGRHELFCQTMKRNKGYYRYQRSEKFYNPEMVLRHECTYALTAADFGIMPVPQSDVNLANNRIRRYSTFGPSNKGYRHNVQLFDGNSLLSINEQTISPTYRATVVGRLDTGRDPATRVAFCDNGDVIVQRNDQTHWQCKSDGRIYPFDSKAHGMQVF